MSLFVMGDLHLSLGSDKPMDVFGPVWEDHAEKIRYNWQRIVGENDTVVLCGDCSWGMSLQNALPDFQFIQALPGKKYLLKGNHDYYWDTVSKMRRFFAENRITSMDFIHNNAFLYGETALCGTRGWFSDEEEKTHDRMIYLRELGRLRASLEAGKALGAKELIVFLHYPPVMPDFRYKEITDMMSQYGVKDCFYGHLHGAGLQSAVNKQVDGIRYHCISADHVKFIPLKIL